MRMAGSIREGKSASPNFDLAVKRHQLLDVIQKASDTGIRQNLNLVFSIDTEKRASTDRSIAGEKPTWRERICTHRTFTLGSTDSPGFNNPATLNS